MATERESGQLMLPFALLLSVATIAAIGFWSILHDWRGQVATQLRLDRCTGSTALGLVQSLREIETTNIAIHAARAGIAISLPFPPNDVPFRIALETLVLRQRWIEMKWKAWQVSWVIRRGCDSRADIPFPLPGFPFQRPAPDALGEKALDWSASPKRQFVLFLKHTPREAAVLIEGEAHGLTTRWKTRWSSARPAILRTSTD